MFTRQRGHGLEQLLRARHRKAWREGGAEASIGAAVPAPGDRQALIDRLSRSLQQTARNRGIGVHHAFADDRPKPHGLERLEDGVGIVHGLHRQHGRRPAQDQLGRRLLRRGRERLGRVRGFHRPDPRLQPIEQRQIVGIAAEDGLTEMDVRLDEPRQHIAAMRVNGAIGACARGCGPDRLDAPVPNQYVALDDVEGVVHGENRRAANQERSRRWRGRHLVSRLRHLWPCGTFIGGVHCSEPCQASRLCRGVPRSARR